MALARLAEQPSLPLCALQAELAARGVRVSYGALWNFVHAEGLSFKKRPSLQPRSSAPTSPDAAPAGSATSTGSTRDGLCSWMVSLRTPSGQESWRTG